MKHFHEDEFKCKCSANNGAGCGMDVVDELKVMCDNARELAGVPFTINSGARCLNHNRAIGSRDTSSHVVGYAVDIFCSITTRFLIEDAMRKQGVTRIGHNFKKNFLHFDIHPSKPSKKIFGY